MAGHIARSTTLARACLTTSQQHGRNMVATWSHAAVDMASTVLSTCLHVASTICFVCACLCVEVLACQPNVTCHSLVRPRHYHVIAQPHNSTITQSHACVAGPDTIKRLRATISALEQKLTELKGCTKVQRFSQLRAQLAEADKVWCRRGCTLTHFPAFLAAVDAAS
eukprot:364892-Chlamydomonas_euryale.AAC.4